MRAAVSPVLLSLLLAGSGLALAVPGSALADVTCVAVGSASVCQPVITSIVGHATSIEVHWIPGGGTAPQHVRLVADGSPGLNFTDGKTLATADEASALGLYSSYVLTAGNLAQGTRLPALHVLGIWGNQALASAGFAGVTEVASADPAPTITAAEYHNDVLGITWNSSKWRHHYNVRWELGNLDDHAFQNEAGRGQTGSFQTHQRGLGTYWFMVEGCDQDAWGKATCSTWSQHVAVQAVAEPPPQERTYSWGHMRAGDCEMDGASITFRSNGTGTFSAKVKTNHTHNRDIWHAKIAGQTAAGVTLFQMATFDSMGMHDEHGYYDWSNAFTYDAKQFLQLGKIDMHHSC